MTEDNWENLSKEATLLENLSKKLKVSIEKRNEDGVKRIFNNIHKHVNSAKRSVKTLEKTMVCLGS